MAVGDLDPTNPGLEKFGAHEVVKHNGGIGAAMLDARTGKLLWSTPADKDTGRGVAADIDPRFPGAEAWATNQDVLYTAQGKPIEGVKRPKELSFLVWWDGDELRELFDRNKINKWDWLTGKSTHAAGGARRGAQRAARRTFPPCQPTCWATGARRSSGARPTRSSCASTRRRMPPSGAWSR